VPPTKHPICEHLGWDSVKVENNEEKEKERLRSSDVKEGFSYLKSQCDESFYDIANLLSCALNEYYSGALRHTFLLDGDGLLVCAHCLP